MEVQVLQISFNGSPLCQICFDQETNKFLIYWVPEDYVEEFVITIKSNESILTWIDLMTNKANVVLTDIKIKKYIVLDDENVEINEIDDYMGFISSNKLLDLIDTQEKTAYQFYLEA